LPSFYGDVTIGEGRISLIGAQRTPDATTMIDARRKIVAPGNVTSHSHYNAAIPVLTHEREPPTGATPGQRVRATTLGGCFAVDPSTAHSPGLSDGVCKRA